MLWRNSRVCRTTDANCSWRSWRGALVKVEATEDADGSLGATEIEFEGHEVDDE